jgi:hypothetical protein
MVVALERVRMLTEGTEVVAAAEVALHGVLWAEQAVKGIMAEMEGEMRTIFNLAVVGAWATQEKWGVPSMPDYGLVGGAELVLSLI